MNKVTLSGRLGRKCVCIEKCEKYCEIGARRMSQEVFPL